MVYPLFRFQRDHQQGFEIRVHEMLLISIESSVSVAGLICFYRHLDLATSLSLKRENEIMAQSQINKSSAYSSCKKLAWECGFVSTVLKDLFEDHEGVTQC